VLLYNIRLSTGPSGGPDALSGALLSRTWSGAVESRNEDSISSLLNLCSAPSCAERDWTLFVAAASPALRGAIVGALRECRVPCDPDLLADLTQEVWCRLLAGERRALSGFRGDSDRAARVYLRRVAARTVFDRLRRGARLKRGRDCAVSLEATPGQAATAVDRRYCPDRRLLARERARALAVACRELVGSRRAGERLRIARLALVEGCTSEEIVELLGPPWTISGVNSFLFRLRRGLARRGFALPRRPGGLTTREG